MLFRRFVQAGPGSSLLLGLPALLLFVAFTGCRTPWRTNSGQPDFDRLIEIERQQSGQTPGVRNSLTARQRPGASLRPSTSARPAGVTSYDELESEDGFELANDRDGSPAVHRTLSDTDELSLEEDPGEELLADVPPGQRDLLRREMTAMRSRGAAALNPPVASKASSRSQSPTVDQQPAPGAAAENAGYVKNSKYQLAADESQRPSRNSIAPRAVESPAYSRSLSDNELPENDLSPDARPVETTLAKSRHAPTHEAVAEQAPSQSEDDAVVAASYASQPKPKGNSLDAAAPTLGWREHIYQALEQLEQEEAASSPEEQVHRAMVDRLLQLSLGDLNAASEPIEGLQTNGQDFIRHSLKALYEATDPAGNPVEIKRYTLAMLSQRKALSHLAAASNLEVLNATFCTEVDGFGVVTKFPQYKFRRDQELLLYCELDNFVSTHLEGKGFETQLQGSYEIVDSTGRRIADQLLPMDSHLCRNQRRDYFIAYRIYMPPNIDPGKYQLKLTVEDLKGRKFGQSNLDFEISL